MNENEIELEITQGSNSETIHINPLQNVLTVYMVCYSVDNRDSFTKAAQILYRLGQQSGSTEKRRVTSIEGKMLSKIYKCPFVEISALLSMNIESLWNETLKKLQKHKSAREKAKKKAIQTKDLTHLMVNAAKVEGWEKFWIGLDDSPRAVKK
uniref:Uncharacterized protein n=1 Tax=Ditylenchus dipsaci TaxID=166011 RepID=A0A915CTQ6_9BILA